MAIKEAYIVDDKNIRILIQNYEYEWFSGFSVSQKQKSIESLHTAIKKSNNSLNVLEISTKSTTQLGVELSAFNLTAYNDKNNKKFTVESAFQGSKVFENGGPYIDLFEKNSKEAKKDERLRNSGKLISFQFFKYKFPLEPKTAFYDWLYLNTLKKNDKLIEGILKYNTFTDIEFNSKKSVNCQAKSVALFILMYKCNLLDYIVADFGKFIEIYSIVNFENEDYQIKLDIN